MQFIKMGLKFENLAECNKWEDENLKDMKYNGVPIMMVMHSEEYGSDAVIIDEIVTV